MRSSRAAITRIALRTGYPVKLAWSGHSRGTMGTVFGVMRHQTGTPVRAGMDDYPTLRVVRDGRPRLENSLCAWGLGRSGCIYCVSEKVSWHAGEGRWRDVTDANGHFWGIEAESDGRTWTVEQLDCYPRLVASALYELGRGVEWAPRHAQWALPRGRKVDTAGIDEDWFDRQVTAYLAHPETINRNRGGLVVPGMPAQEEDDMFTDADRDQVQAARAAAERAYNKANAAEAGIRQALAQIAELRDRPEYDLVQVAGQAAVWMVTGSIRVHVPNQEILAVLGGLGAVEQVTAADPRMRLPELPGSVPA